DEGMLNYGVRTENYYNLPPGPNNLVGILWMGLNKPGIGIHGTNNPETIGRAASHGCIRLANWDAARVKDLVNVGNTVIIFWVGTDRRAVRRARRARPTKFRQKFSRRIAT